MKFLVLATLLSFGVFNSVLAQNTYSIKGVVVDSVNHSKLHLATISILNAKDSTLYKYTRANQAGTFSIPSMRKGNFILLLTYPAYADYVSMFTLDATKTSYDFKEINMISKAMLINEIMISGKRAAIKINGDTTEFNAGSYTIQPNDKVEDLLKKFPGIQVDKDGKITAQGRKVSKVLVDGEEFFGDDPTLVTKNIRADMVDKVQLYEKSSDQAAFTGVDDGEKKTTLNIKLKENAKNGYFGKAELGVGTEDFYGGQILFNKFKGKEKFSIFGTGSNTGKTGLSWQDSNKYGTSSGSSDDIDSGGGSYNGEGIPIAYNGGAHYQNKWNTDKESINANYKVGSLNVDVNKNIISQQNIPGEIVNRTNDQLTNNFVFRQKLDATYQITLDSTSVLKIMTDGTLKRSNSKSAFTTIGSRENNSLLNTELRRNNNEGNEQIFNASAFYTKKLKKLGRNYSINVNESLNDKNNEGFLYALNEAYDLYGVKTESIVTDQYKTNNIKNSFFSTNVTYNEPLSKKLSLVLNYGFSLNSGRADRKSFNATTPGNYNDLDRVFSNNFKTDQFSNQGGAILTFRNNKTAIQGGLKVDNTNFDQFDEYNSIRYKKNFFNLMPQARYQYRFSQSGGISIYYNGRTTQPNVTQLQPVKVNDDLLNVPIGNPNLAPSYSNNFSVNYESYRVVSQQSIDGMASLTFSNNEIVNSTSFNNLNGRSEYQFINLENKTPFIFAGYITIDRKLKALNFNMNVGVNTALGKNYSYVNSVLNEIRNSEVGFTVGFSKYVEKKFDFNVSFGPSYQTQESSVNKDINSNGLATSGNSSLTVYLPAKFQINADVNYKYNAKTASFANSFEQTIINSSISKTFFTADNLKLSISGNDLLKQNSGFSRYANANTITQAKFNNIKRYFMFSLVWDFNKMGVQQKNN